MAALGQAAQDNENKHKQVRKQVSSKSNNWTPNKTALYLGAHVRVQNREEFVSKPVNVVCVVWGYMYWNYITTTKNNQI